MRKLLVPLVLLVSLGLMAPAEAAQVSGSIATLTTEDGAFTTNCSDIPPRYRITAELSRLPDANRWTADITIDGPSFHRAVYLESDSRSDRDWQRIWSECGGYTNALPGTYTVQAKVAYLYNHAVRGGETLTTTFNLTVPADSSVTVRKKKSGAHRWKFVATVKRDGVPWARKQVILQGWACGSWRKVRSGRTNKHGKLYLFGPNARDWNNRKFCGKRGRDVDFRFLADTDTYTWGYYSRKFHISYR